MINRLTAPATFLSEDESTNCPANVSFTRFEVLSCDQCRPGPDIASCIVWLDYIMFTDAPIFVNQYNCLMNFRIQREHDASHATIGVVLYDCRYFPPRLY